MFSFRFRLSLWVPFSYLKSTQVSLLHPLFQNGNEQNKLFWFFFNYSFICNSWICFFYAVKFNYFDSWMASKLFLTRKSRWFRLTLGFHRYLKNFDGSVESFFLFCFFTFQQRKCISSLPLYHCLAFARELWTLNRCWNKNILSQIKF